MIYYLLQFLNLELNLLELKHSVVVEEEDYCLTEFLKNSDSNQKIFLKT